MQKSQYVQPPSNILYLTSLTAWRTYQMQNMTR